MAPYRTKGPLINTVQLAPLMAESRERTYSKREKYWYKSVWVWSEKNLSSQFTVYNSLADLALQLWLYWLDSRSDNLHFYIILKPRGGQIWCCWHAFWEKIDALCLAKKPCDHFSPNDLTTFEISIRISKLITISLWFCD